MRTGQDGTLIRDDGSILTYPAWGEESNRGRNRVIGDYTEAYAALFLPESEDLPAPGKVDEKQLIDDTYDESEGPPVGETQDKLPSRQFQNSMKD
uniref:Lipoprotein n=1 Tax=Rhabditophanes sp. KR3021 TaxID=114890 RepID=A0AC35UA22_9BILA